MLQCLERYTDAEGTMPSASVLCTLFVCLQGVEHEHADGHGTYSARHGGDGRAQGGYRLEVHVALKAESAGA